MSIHIVITKPERALLLNEDSFEIRRFFDVEQLLDIASTAGQPPVFVDVHNLWGRGLVDRMIRLGYPRIYWLTE